MECHAQSYWHTEYKEYQYASIHRKTPSTYRQYAKRQFHKARRQYDKELIEEQIMDAINLNPDVWLNTVHLTDIKSNMINPTTRWEEHDHTYKVEDICTSFVKNQLK